MSRVLVTGGAGYVGSECAAALLAAGDEVVILDDLSTGHRQAVPPGAELIEASLADEATLERTLSARPFDAVFHFAARSLVGESMADPLGYLGETMQHAVSLLRAMVRHDVGRIVLSSTAAVYGTAHGAPIDEDAAIAPNNPYGEAKAMVERTLRWVGERHGVRWAALRYFNAAGADPDAKRGEDHRPETHLIPLLASVALGQERELTLFGSDYPTPDGSCVRDYVHVCDLADAHRAALGALEQHASLVLNLGSGQGASVREVIDCARAVTGRPIAVNEAPRREGDPAFLVASAARARTLLGWEPRHDLRSIVETAWRWHEAHPRGYDG
jgi:UDP-glucose 4-epimerase